MTLHMSQANYYLIMNVLNTRSYASHSTSFNVLTRQTPTFLKQIKAVTSSCWNTNHERVQVQNQHRPRSWLYSKIMTIGAGIVMSLRPNHNKHDARSFGLVLRHLQPVPSSSSGLKPTKPRSTGTQPPLYVYSTGHRIEPLHLRIRQTKDFLGGILSFKAADLLCMDIASRSIRGLTSRRQLIRRWVYYAWIIVCVSTAYVDPFRQCSAPLVTDSLLTHPLSHVLSTVSYLCQPHASDR